MYICITIPLVFYLSLVIYTYICLRSLIYSYSYDYNNNIYKYIYKIK